MRQKPKGRTDITNYKNPSSVIFERIHMYVYVLCNLTLVHRLLHKRLSISISIILRWRDPTFISGREEASRHFLTFPLRTNMMS